MKMLHIAAGLALACFALLAPQVASAADLIGHAVNSFDHLGLTGLAGMTALAGASQAGGVKRVRGLLFARAEAKPEGLTETLNELKKTFEDFKAENEAKIAEVKKGFDDVVQTEKVDRINAAITDQNKAIEDIKASLDALRVGGGGGDAPDADVKAHSDAFKKWFRRGDQQVEATLHGLQVKAGLTTQSDPDGGYLVPEEMESGIDRVLGTVSAIRSLLRVVSVGTDEYAKLVNLGGAGTGWVGEEEARPETTTPTLSKIIVNSGEIYANPAATQRSLDDAAFDVEGWLADEVSIAFAEAEGAAFWDGNGINKPKGINTYTKVADASYAWGKLGFIVTGGASGFASSNPADAIIQLYYALKSGYRAGASFLSSDATIAEARQFKDGQGNYLWAPPTVDMPATILGKPVATDDNVDALGSNNFPMAFGNFQRGYLIADRTGVRVLRDPYTNKPNVHFYTTKRVGGAVINFEAIKLLKCST